MTESRNVVLDEVRANGLRYVKVDEGDWQQVWLVSNSRIAMQYLLMRIPLGHPLGEEAGDRMRRAFRAMAHGRDIDALPDFGLHLPPGNGGSGQDCAYIDGGACSFHPSHSYGLTFTDRVATWLSEHETANRDEAIFELLTTDINNFPVEDYGG